MAQKKLTDAGRYWVSASGSSKGDKDDLIEDMEAFGFSEEDKEEMLKRGTNKDSEDFEVWQENWEALNIFLICSTQWISSPNGITGLYYPSLFGLIDRLVKKKKRVEVLGCVQCIESGVLLELSDRKQKNGPR